MTKMQHEELTRRVIGCAYTVYNTLGGGFLESVYQNALLLELDAAGIEAKSQVQLDVEYRGHTVGHFFADIVVEQRIIIELKAIEALHKSHEVQLVNYLAATGTDIGLLLNFGPKGVEVKRKVRELSNLSR
ncbi:GxxExxY protein [Aeoliella sp. ICT_H6.2]|uniref:GxxExxY protein n=1 Tax=Aeoliella straminimaris TaxID=2954799 RepID=A0A9X2JK84_9BACT|nr:GxxExxY protein [Aeoliella straminimaris]MCO6047803.1 GxxExxY protein [Aeoliella straminimaris]